MPDRSSSVTFLCMSRSGLVTDNVTKNKAAAAAGNVVSSLEAAIFCKILAGKATRSA